MPAKDVLVATSSSEKRNDPRGKPAAFVPAANRASAENPNSVPLVFVGAGRVKSLLVDLKGKDLVSLALAPVCSGYQLSTGASALRLMDRIRSLMPMLESDCVRTPCLGPTVAAKTGRAMTIRIANAAGFWGDDPDAPRRLLASAEVDYLTLEYLAELTMSILAHHRSKDPQAGFATDFLGAMQHVLAAFQRQPKLKVITNAGGMNPHACAQAVARQMIAEGFPQERIAVVSGDDLLSRLADLQAVCPFHNLDTGEPLSTLKEIPASANAYLGASPIAESLAAGARIVITGRVADASLTLGPVMFEYGWAWDDWDRLAAATVAGHLIECGAQVTGGYSDRWQEIDFADIGYPIAEIEPDGSTIITKPPGSGGVVDRRSVVEQLIYEIGDPNAYITPDVIADFTTVEVTELGQDRVLVRGASGKPAPDSLKVSLAYPNGFTSSAILLVRGAWAAEKARFIGELVLERLRRREIILQRTNIECLGAGDGIPITERGGPRETSSLSEVVLRISVQDPRREAVESFTKQIATLITSGPSGLAGYAAGRPSVRPVLAYWPTLVPKAVMAPVIDVRSAADWSTSASPTE